MPFSENTLDFLFENRVRDSREWFKEHKGQYEQLVLEPMRRLVTELTPVMMEIDPLMICEPKVGRSISRIYRDTRFSRDKSVFRDVMWCLFIRDKKLYEGLPGFFFEISPVGFRYGCGYYKASAASMNAMRELITGGDREFKKAMAAYEKQKVFKLIDERYKRSKYADRTESEREWLDQKSICLVAESGDLPLLFSQELSAKLAEDFRLLAPVYSFLMKAESRVQKQV